MCCKAIGNSTDAVCAAYMELLLGDGVPCVQGYCEAVSQKQGWSCLNNNLVVIIFDMLCLDFLNLKISKSFPIPLTVSEPNYFFNKVTNVKPGMPPSLERSNAISW